MNPMFLLSSAIAQCLPVDPGLIMAVHRGPWPARAIGGGAGVVYQNFPPSAISRGTGATAMARTARYVTTG
jgi:hypothetical protein